VTIARLSLGTFFVIAWHLPAVAEVCDKMNPSWSPSDGPVEHIGNAMNEFTGPFGIALLLVFIASFVLNRWWISAFSAFLAGFLAWFHMGERWFSDSAYLGAIKEGCLAEPYALVAILALMFSWSVWRAFKAKKWNWG
jgi:hypothetical protein